MAAAITIRNWTESMNPNGSTEGESRLDRLERLVEVLSESHEKTESELRVLAGAQVVMSETVTKLSEKMIEINEKLNALIRRMDDHLRDHREHRT